MSTIKCQLEEKAQEAEKFISFSGIKLLHIKNSIEQILSLIGRNNIFEEYTKHDITHIDEMLRIAEWLIPEETKKSMTILECLMLVLSIYFHDLGMLVTNKEYENRNNLQFEEYKKKIENNEFGCEYKEKVYSLGENSEKFMYQEFVRSKHAERIENWINGNNHLEYGQANEIIEEIDKILYNLDSMFRVDLAMLCKSHHLDDLDDFEKYKTDSRYGNSEEEKVNLHYIAIVLRTADLLHITNDRTPTIQYNLVNPSDPISIIEWQKQMAVRSVNPKIKVNNEGFIDKKLDMDTVEITAYFDGADQAEAFFGLSAYLIYARKEIERSYDIIQNSIKMQGTDEYQFPWKYIDDKNVRTSGFEPKHLQFTLEQDSILQLLVGHTLYNDSTVVLREIIQNSLDAIKLQNLIEKNEKEVVSKGLIKIIWDSNSRELSFIDNGTGMTINEVENFLLKVGKSRYRTDEFSKKYPDFAAISRFGIGILTCFLISDDIDIITNSKEEKQANEISIRKVNGKYLLKKVEKLAIENIIQKHGTMIKLHVRQMVDMSEILLNIRKWIVIPSSEIILIIDKNTPINIGYKTPKEALEDYLDKNDYLESKTKVEVKQQTVNGVTVAYAVMYNEFLGEWNFLRIDNRNIKNNNNDFIGTCIEGIRVEFNTPGYNECGILALANIEGNSSVKTNVARSAIESNKKNEALLNSIYEIFKNQVQEQLEVLYENNGRSLAWVASESKYLISSILSSERGNIRAQDEKILNNVLNDIKCIIIENELNERKLISPNDLRKIDEFYIIDSDMVKAAERLFREVKTDERLCKLINTLNSDDNNKLFGMKNIICNFDNNNLLHMNALQMKEVNLIKIYRKHRRIDLRYGANSNLWHEFTLYDHRKYRNIQKIYIPLKHCIIEGIQDEIGVNTVSGLYLRYDHEFVKYLKVQIDKFEYKNNRKDLNTVMLFLTLIFNTSVLEINSNKSDNKNNIFDNILERESGISISREAEISLWSKVNKDELCTFLFKNKYNIYDNSKWTRNTFELRNFYY